MTVGSSSWPEERSTRLCVVSGKRLLCGQFVAALQTVMNPHDEFEIVVDRRRERVLVDARPDTTESRDRRRNPHVDRLLKMDGFAIVPNLAAARRADRTPLPQLFPQVTIERVLSENREDEERLESVRNFIRERAARRAARRAASVVVAGLMSAVVVLLAPSPELENLVGRARSEAPSEGQPGRVSQDNEPGSNGTQAPPLTANPSIVPPSGLPEAPSPMTTENPPTDVPSESPVASLSDANRSAPPLTTKTPTGAQTRPTVGASPAATPAVRAAALQHPGLPRVNGVRSPAAAGSGPGESYALRISDPAGRPRADADVSLLARMAADTVQSSPRYEATEPGSRTAVDLRVRVTMSDKRVEIPLTELPLTP